MNKSFLKLAVIGGAVSVLLIGAYFMGKDSGIEKTEKKYAGIIAEKDTQLLSAKQIVLEIARQSIAALEAAYKQQAEASMIARKQNEILQSDLDRLRIANSGLRDKAKRYSDRLQGFATVATGGDSAEAPRDMLPDMLARCGEALGRISEYADRARIAGLTCERLR